MKYPILLSTLLLAASCSSDEQPIEDLSNPIIISAQVAEMHTAGLTRATTSPLPDGNYTLYLPEGSKPVEGGKPVLTQTYTVSGGNGELVAGANIYWDDIKPNSTPTETLFIFSNANGELAEGQRNIDILWGKTTGWNKPLAFELEHKMAQLTFVLKDGTHKGDLKLEDSKVKFTTSLVLEAKSFDGRTGVLVPADKVLEPTLPLKGSAATITEKTSTLTFGLLPPQTLIKESPLVVTAGGYLFNVNLPKEYTDANNFKHSLDKLNKGEHLTVTITLKDNEVSVKATLEDWKSINGGNIEISRVFNVSSEAELADLALAVSTGHSFEKMIIRQTTDITLKKDITIGTSSFPFKGIYDGGGKSISGLGQTGGQAATALFKNTKDATIMNLKLVNPNIAGNAALVDQASNTTFFGCIVTGGNIAGSGQYVGAIVGKTDGETTLTNCEVSNTTISGKKYVGGITGYADSSIDHCSVSGTGTISGNSYVGGLAGYTNGMVRNCYVRNEVKGTENYEGTDNYVGGLIGYANGDVSYSYASGTVSGKGQDVGGLLGSIGFDGAARYCYWNKSAITADNTPGAGVADITSENLCSGFAIGENIVAGKLETNNPGVWVMETVGDKLPTFTTTP